MANKVPVEKYIENIRIKTGKTPDDGYGKMIASGIKNGLERLQNYRFR